MNQATQDEILTDFAKQVLKSVNAPVAGKTQLYENAYALVIGMYAPGWPRLLSMAVKDAQEIAAELEQRGFEVTLASNLKSDELKSALEEFYALKREDPEARLFIWYAQLENGAVRIGFYRQE